MKAKISSFEHKGHTIKKGTKLTTDFGWGGPLDEEVFAITLEGDEVVVETVTNSGCFIERNWNDMKDAVVKIK